MPLRIVGSDISPLLFTTNRMITRPSVCSFDSFLRVFEIVFDKREQRFGSAGKFGHDFRDFEGSFRCFGSGCRAIFRLNFRGFGEYFFNFGLKRLLVCTALVGSYDSQEKG